jgi:hypothetical protein
MELDITNLTDLLPVIYLAGVATAHNPDDEPDPE